MQVAWNQSFAQLSIGLKSKVLVLSTYLTKSAIPWYKPIIAYFLKNNLYYILIKTS